MNDDHLETLTKKLDILETCVFAAQHFMQDYEGPESNITMGFMLAYQQFRQAFDQIETIVPAVQPPCPDPN